MRNEIITQRVESQDKNLIDANINQYLSHYGILPIYFPTVNDWPILISDGSLDSAADAAVTYATSHPDENVFVGEYLVEETTEDEEGNEYVTTFRGCVSKAPVITTSIGTYMLDYFPPCISDNGKPYNRYRIDCECV